MWVGRGGSLRRYRELIDDLRVHDLQHNSDLGIRGITFVSWLVMAGVSLYVVIGMAIQTLKRWGNSLAVRIPANVANEAAFPEGQEVDVQVQDGQVMVRPHTGIRRFSRERFIQQLRGQQHSTCRRTWLRTVQAFASLVGLDTLLESRQFSPKTAHGP